MASGNPQKWHAPYVKKQHTKNALHDVHQVNAPEPQIPHKWEDQYRRLRMLRERLLNDRNELIRDTKYPVEVDGFHMADKATDEFERDLDLGLLSAEGDALFEIEEAMRRIERGSYGICELTSAPIPMTRLRAIPWTRFTAEAEKELEKIGAVGKAHLGKLGRVETEPSALSRELERIQPSEAEIATQSLEKLAESVERPSDEEPASEVGENNELGQKP